MSEISSQDIEALLALFERTEWKVMHLTLGDFEMFLSKDGSGMRMAGASAAPPAQVAAAAPNSVAAVVPAPPATAAQDSAEKHASNVPEGWAVVTAPSLGTFYRAPKPGAANFTEVGSKVTGESELCLIEVMKLFTTMRATVTGTVSEIYAEDGELVEFGQPLFLIKPDV